MECEVCGKEIFGKAYKGVIDSARLFVCNECAQFSTAKWRLSKKLKRTTPEYQISRLSTIRRNISSRVSDELDLVEDYGLRIRKGRMKLKLSHEDLSRKIGAKVSILRKLETGKMVPTQALAERLERFLKIKILQSLPETHKNEKGIIQKQSKLTLRDVIIKRKGAYRKNAVDNSSEADEK